MNRVRMLTLAAAMLLVAPTLLAQNEQSTPNPDDPPAFTHSAKVLPSRDANRPPALGPNPTKATVVVFSDFQCPVCQRSANGVRQIAEEFPGDVRVEFHPIALKIHKNAANAAVAALAAQRQGKFWEMHDVLFKNQASLDPDGLVVLARDAGLDPKRFAKDYADPALRKRIAREDQLAEALGATSTPTFLINGKVTVGWASWSALRNQVQQEINAANELLAKGAKLPDIHAMRAKANAKDDAAFKSYKAAIIDPLVAKPGARRGEAG